MTMDDNRLKRLSFRSFHRGCKETDLLLGNFAANHLASLPAELLDVYEALLEEADWDIWRWACGGEGYDPQYAPLITLLREPA